VLNPFFSGCKGAFPAAAHSDPPTAQHSCARPRCPWATNCLDFFDAGSASKPHNICLIKMTPAFLTAVNAIPVWLGAIPSRTSRSPANLLTNWAELTGQLLFLSFFWPAKTSHAQCSCTSQFERHCASRAPLTAPFYLSRKPPAPRPA
jgi:hypothetical protein